MLKYQNILFVSTGSEGEVDALKQALSLARNHKAKLNALIIHPKFPSDLGEYEKEYEKTLVNNLRDAIREVGAETNFETDEINITIQAEKRNKPVVSIIKHVLKGSFDLVVKQTEKTGSVRGFAALDMALLRQCPCPVWICRPIASHRHDIKIAAAIEAESETEEGKELSLKILQQADMLAKDCGDSITVLSCWDYEFEDELKDNPWISVANDKIESIVEDVRVKSSHSLDRLVSDFGIQTAVSKQHLKGSPEQLIPQFVEEHGIDILVMGTVARSGISGFIIGNTAENILQNIGCTLLALKPSGFVSPVKV